ncbi:MAG: EAL domain-containing protein [Chloroflexi bacterium]|nr:MAG: EAL domain-containing protein [Chloroflexota bacterium]
MGALLRLMGPQPPPSRVTFTPPLVTYVAAVATVAALLTGRWMTAPTDVVGVTLVSAAILAMSLTSTQIGSVRMSVSATSFLHLGLAITSGPFGVLAASLAEVVAVAVRFRSGWFRSVFNLSNSLLCGLAAWATYHALLTLGGPVPVRTALAGVGAGAAHYVINYGLITGVLTLATGRHFLDHVRAALSAAPYHLMYGYAAVSFVVLRDDFGPWGFTFALAPVAALQINLIILARRSAAHERERAAQNEALRTSERSFRVLFESNPHPMWVVDATSLRIIAVNDAAVAEYGYSSEEFLDSRLADITESTGVEHGWNPASEPDVRRLLQRHRLRGGNVIDVEVSSHATEFEGRRAVLVLAQDITERIRLEEQLRDQALHDPLTRLANRLLLQDRIEHALVRQRRTAKPFALLLLDLDNFKTVNDSLGHAAGDHLLVAVAGRLKSCLRGSDSAARLGGDEFAILLEEVTGPEHAASVAERLVEALRMPFTVEQREIFLGVSIGVAMGDSTRQSADEMLRDADLAMYAAKAQGRSRHVVFSPRMREAALDRVALEHDLRRSVNAGDLHLVYQPQIDLETDETVGVEALVRWRHPVHGNVPPDRFIPLAEEAGLIGALDAWVLETACAQIKAWREAGAGGLHVAVNLSGSEFEDGALVDRIADVLERHRLAPSDLELEITERVAVQQERSARETLDRLRAMGVRISIDDFGTGYSMLASLRQFPGDKLKVDKSFVQEIVDGQDRAPLVAAIVAMGHGLGLEVIAEGVETEEQLTALRRLGCDGAQGYLLGRPTEAREIEERVLAERAAVRAAV